MHRFFCVLLALSAVLCAVPAVADEYPVIPLRDNWRLHTSDGLAAEGAALSTPGFDTTGWHPTTVPKTVLAALVDNGVYPDPYFGVNMTQIPGYQEGAWLRMADDSPFRSSWWFRTEFTGPAISENEQVTLHFDGLNYKANIWLDGEKIAGEDTVQGMFRRFEFNVTKQMLNKPNPHVLAVEIIPPGLVPDKKYGTKQIEATTGWDDHNPQPPDGNMGLWQPVYLRVQGPVSLRNPYVETKLDVPGLEEARLTASVFARNNTPDPVTCTVSVLFQDLSFAQEVSLAGGETREVFFRPEEWGALVVKNPRVWWPHPLGPQELYDIEFGVITNRGSSDKARTRFGIREITTAIDDDNWRYYMVNGRRVLIRGGAWMTSDMLLNLSRDRYETLIRYAREANLNMLRSEGFSIRETEDFYSLCDELGIMATQQLFGRSIPDEPLAIACVEDTLLRIRNHPSLAHFLGHDETFPTPTLDEAYRGLIEKHRVNRTYQPHSGTFNIATRKKTGGTRTGTRELWTYASPAHYYFTERKQDVAWGFAQSGGIGGILAPRDSLRQMMPADQLWPAMKTEAWSLHTVTQGAEYFNVVLQMMDAQYGAPADLEAFCNRLYAMNYNSARGMFEAFGKNRYAATGITTWKYNAAWPAALTWQYVDWYGRATAAYYGAKKACTPLHALYAYNDGAVYVTNSLYEPKKDLMLTAAFYGTDGAPVGKVQETSVDLAPDTVAKIPDLEVPESLGSLRFLKLELRDAAGALVSDNFYWLSATPDIPGRDLEMLGGDFKVEPKSMADFKALADLPKVTPVAELKQTRDANGLRLEAVVSNPSPHVAFLVQLAATNPETGLEIGPTYWSENYFSLLPGETRTVTAEVPAYALPKGEAALRVTNYNAAQ